MDEEPMRFWESVLCRGGGDLSPQARRLVRFAAEYASSELLDHPEAYEGPDSFEPYLAVIYCFRLYCKPSNVRFSITVRLFCVFLL